MIAKDSSAYGQPTATRALARPAPGREWGETTVESSRAGGSPNKSFVLDLLDQPEVIDAKPRTTGWIDPGPRPKGRLVEGQAGTPGIALWPRRPIEALRGTRRRSPGRRLLATPAPWRPPRRYSPRPAGPPRSQTPAAPPNPGERGSHRANQRFRVGISAGGAGTCPGPTGRPRALRLLRAARSTVKRAASYRLITQH